MRRKAFIAHIARQTGHTQKDVGEIYDAIIEAVLSDMKVRGKTALPGLFTGKTITWAARQEREIYVPTTGERRKIAALPPRKKVRLRLASKAERMVSNDCQ